MFGLVRMILLIAAFVGGCQMQNWVAIDACLDRGGQWARAEGALPGGVCIGAKAG